MLDRQKVLERYQENYQLALEDGHGDKAKDIAWQWTQDELRNQFSGIKEQHYWQHVESVNKTFFG